MNVSELSAIIFNGTNLSRLEFNGITVWKKGGTVVAGKFLGGNQKMNLKPSEIASWAEGIKAALAGMDFTSEVVLFPQTINILPMVQAFQGTNIKIGAQLVSPQAKGAFTGQNSVEALADAGVRYFLVGNNEVCQLLGPEGLVYPTAKTNSATDVDGQLGQILENGGTAVIDIAVTLGEYESEGGVGPAIQRRMQYYFGLNRITDPLLRTGKIVFNYVPAWAIGTGKTCSAEQAQEACRIMRNILSDQFGEDVAANTKIIYGGALNPRSGAEYFHEPDVNGGMAGGASLNTSFVELIEQLENS